MPRVLLGAVLTACLAAGTTGCPSCPYDTQCDGTTLKFCSVGVDQLVGDPSYSSRECTAPNAACITLNPRTALCAMDASSTCAADAAPSCQGDLLVSCQQGYQVAVDCAAAGNRCGTLDAADQCYLDPATPCDPQAFSEYCQGDAILECPQGYLVRRQCIGNGTDPACRLWTNEYGHGAVCAND